MKVTKKKVEDGKVMLEALASPAEVDKALHQAQLKFAMQMGLRPQKDKTIAQVAEEKMGIRDLDSIVSSSAVDYLLPFALDKKGITPAYPPEALPSSTLRRGKEFSFRVNVMPKPEFELTSYEPVSITVPPYEANDAAVQKQLDDIADRYATYVKDECEPHPVEKGNHVLLSIEAVEGGKRLEGLSTPGRTYSVGLGFMPDGFDENIIGMMPGETKSFTFEGPGVDKNGNEKTETVECTVTVIELQKRVLPTIDDEWVKTYMPMYKSYDEFKAEVEKQVNGEDRRMYDEYVRNAAAAKLAERFRGRIDDAIYESMRDTLMKNLRQNLEQQNMTLDDFIEQNGGKQMFDMQLMMQTRQSLIQGFALDALFRHEHLVVTDEDIDEACELMSPRNPKAARRDMEENGRNFALREIVERYCANKWLVDHAEITYKKPEEGAGQASDSEKK